MQAAIYFYTLGVIVVCVITGAVSLSAYFVSRKPLFLCMLSMFLFYSLEVAFIFWTEFEGQNIAFAMEDYYAIEAPWAKLIVSVGVLGSLWAIVCRFVAERRLSIFATPIAAYALVCTVIVVALPETALRQYLFYTMRQALLLWMLAFAFYRYRTIKSAPERCRMRRYRWLFWASAALWCLIVAEDVFIILLVQPEDALAQSLLPLYLCERNFSENAFVLVWAAGCLRVASAMLRLRAAEPPDPEQADLERYIEEVLPSYCKRNGLTPREREILVMVVQGKDNQQIASELMLALGTVKTHVHNIFKKTAQPSRPALLEDFWRE